MRVAGYVSVFVGGVVFCYLLFSLGVVDKIDGIPGTQQEPFLSIPTYLSFISVLMTAITVVLAAIAIFIGIVAAFTFKDLSEKAENSAQRRVDILLSDEAIIARIDDVAFRNRSEQNLGELEADFDPTDEGER